MVTKSISVVCMAILFSIHANAQEDQPVQDTLPSATKRVPMDTTRQAMNGWYVHIAGESLIGITANYERYFSRKPGGLSMHAGVGGIYLNINGSSAGYVTIPMGLSYNIPTSKKYRSFIELGGGYTYTTISGEGVGGFYPVIGWRFLAKPRGLQIRATCLPFVNLSGQTVAPFFGFSIGTKF